eukprot:Gb_23369 [translate_table: standard]
MAKLVDKAKLFVVEKVAHIEKPSADVTDLSIKHVSKGDVTLESEVDIMNPYSHDLPICEIAYKFRSGDRVIASGTIADPGSVKANDKTGFKIPVKVPYDFLLSILRDVGGDWDIDYDWEVGLNMNIPIVGKFTLPLSQKGTLKLPTLSDIF